ncbi:MAG: menaquinone biosynthesis protein [Chlamydiales bacterium]|nr:menaquinone biosynthesis protein [Chlamydiales bacterium]
MTRIGLPAYINALPFHLPFTLGELKTGHSFECAIPSVLNKRLRTNTLDAALTSCAEYFDGPYRSVPGYCIGAHKEILSVNLYIRGSVDGARIGCTHHSATSIALLKVLCRYFWKVEADFVPLRENEAYDGMLIIGDDALKQMTIPGYKTIDLAAAWHEATGLPFVFAVISTRDGIAFPEEEFEAALKWSESNRERLVEAAHSQSQLPKSLINRYYDICNYRLGEKELEGLNLFKELREGVSKVCS